MKILFRVVMALILALAGCAGGGGETWDTGGSNTILKVVNETSYILDNLYFEAWPDTYNIGRVGGNNEVSLEIPLVDYSETEGHLYLGDDYMLADVVRIKQNQITTVYLRGTSRVTDDWGYDERNLADIPGLTGNVDDGSGGRGILKIVNNSSHNIAKISYSNSDFNDIGAGRNGQMEVDSGTSYVYFSLGDGTKDFRTKEALTVPGSGTKTMTLHDNTLVYKIVTRDNVRLEDWNNIETTYVLSGAGINENFDSGTISYDWGGNWDIFSSDTSYGSNRIGNSACTLKISSSSYVEVRFSGRSEFGPLYFYIDGAETERIIQPTFRQYTNTLPSGTYTLKWLYNSTSDRAFIDDLVIRETSTPAVVSENFDSGVLRESWNGDWFIESGAYRSASGVPDNGSSFASLTVTLTEASTIRFSAKTSCGDSMFDDDGLDFYIDGSQQYLSYGNRLKGDGEVSTFELFNFNVSSGTHTFKWEYNKDSSGSGLSDCVYIDDVSISGR